MDKNNKKKEDQLGVPLGTASNRLRKNILFHVVQKLGENFCYRCGFEITNTEQLSIEHKEHWLDSHNPVDLFFNMDNIAFSHLSCNIAAGRRKLCDHGTPRKYDQGCRCIDCTKANTIKIFNKRNRQKIA